ncbi:MAG: L-threonylcarbamoyladenylate synthase [Opitutales bacterium]
MHHLIFEPSSAAFDKCAALLRSDELVAVPTETVYGLAGNALSEIAVRKIFTVKGRPLIDPLITHFKDAESAFSHTVYTRAAESLASAFWPGPLTLVCEKLPVIPDLVTAGLKSAAIRVPSQPHMQRLLRLVDFPLAAPSANPFGYVSPTQSEHVAKTLGHKIQAILDGGSCEHGLESTVLDIRNPSKPSILRPGPVSAEKIESVLGCELLPVQPSTSGVAQTSPGQLMKHYSPKTAIEIVEHGDLEGLPPKGSAFIANRKPALNDSKDVYWLSEDGDITTIARNFYSLLQKLDQMKYKQLLVENAPNRGLGIALNDRLRRAASK